MDTDLLTTCCCTSEPTFDDPAVDPWVEVYEEPYVDPYVEPYADPYVVDDWAGELAPAPAPVAPLEVAVPAPPVVLDPGPFGDGSGYYTGAAGEALPSATVVLEPGPFGDGSGFYTGAVGEAYSTATGDFDAWRSFGMPESGVPHPSFVAAQNAVPTIKPLSQWGIGPGSSYSFPSTGVSFPSQSIADIQNANVVTLQQLGILHRTGQQAHAANSASLFG
jgi:hypothetical protein